MADARSRRASDVAQQLASSYVVPLVLSRVLRPAHAELAAKHVRNDADLDISVPPNKRPALGRAALALEGEVQPELGDGAPAVGHRVHRWWRGVLAADVLERLYKRAAAMQLAACDMIRTSYEGVADFSGTPLGPPTHQIVTSNLSPTLKALAQLVTVHPMSHAAASDWVQFLNTHFVPKDSGCFDLPPDGNQLFSSIIPEMDDSTEQRFTVDELEGAVDKQKREKIARKNPFIASLPRLLPPVRVVTHFEDWLHKVVNPYWAAGKMLWYPKKEYATCPITGEISRFYGHPYSGDVAIAQYEVLKERFGPDVKMLGVVIYIDASYQHGKKMLHMVIGLLPSPDAFRTDRARETCLALPGLRVPKEMKAERPLFVVRRLVTTLYQRAVYEGFVKKINDIIERGGACVVCSLFPS